MDADQLHPGTRGATTMTVNNPMISLIIALWIGSWMAGCQSVHPPQLTGNTPARVLIINSDHSVPRYEVAESAFIKTLQHSTVLRINLQDDNLPIETVLDELQVTKPDIIYCIGAKALGTVQSITPKTPVVYSSVLSWRQFLNQPGYYGVTSEIAPAAQLAWFKHFFPEIKRIGVLYSHTNSDLIREAHHTAEQLALTLIDAEVEIDSARAQEATQLLGKVDALWILPNPVVLDSQPHTTELFELAQQAKVAVFGYHPVFMEFGATMSINADLATTGRQAALIVQSILEQQSQASAIQFPAGSNISLNLRRVRDYQLYLNPEALNSVSDLLNH
ncbi:MAG: hypothetical protein CMK83_22615 [Pseudomonadales bacterium]|nr:hypothetical protein [Pseudomonadales bacterium]HAG94146.1 hypothetical protein [Gammaproteobacteria bacterium]HBO95434.1 hypothetical protein [Gammaproteobacteria bacterium]